MADDRVEIDILRIMRLLPHRYPFLLVDRVIECTPGVSIKAYKNVTANEPFFMGHFPGLPVMPGVLILEALAQAGGVAILSGSDLPLNDKIFLFTGMNKVRFRRPVLPGDRLVLEVGDIRNKLSLWKMSGVASVDGEVVAEGELSAAMVDRESM